MCAHLLDTINAYMNAFMICILILELLSFSSYEKYGAWKRVPSMDRALVRNQFPIGETKFIEGKRRFSLLAKAILHFFSMKFKILTQSIKISGFHNSDMRLDFIAFVG